MKPLSLILLITLWIGCKNDSYPTIHRIVYGLPDTISACSCFVRDTLHYGYNDTANRVVYITDSVYYRKCPNWSVGESGKPMFYFEYGINDTNSYLVTDPSERLYFKEAQGDGFTPEGYTKEDFIRQSDSLYKMAKAKGWPDNCIMKGVGSYVDSNSDSKTSLRWQKMIANALSKQDSIKQHPLSIFDVYYSVKGVLFYLEPHIEVKASSTEKAKKIFFLTHDSNTYAINHIESIAKNQSYYGMDTVEFKQQHK